MVRTVEVRPYDDESVEITLPADITERLNLKAGETMYAVETATGILLTRSPQPAGDR